MKKSFLFFCFLLVLSQVIKGQTDLTFSEIMFAPESSTSEFIEIYNLSDSTIDLTGYQFKYYTAKNDEIISTGNGLKLASHSFAVIFENDYDINIGVYKNLVPTNALVLKISDNAFGSTGMSNSSNRAVVLLNKNGDTVNVYTYSADNEKGYSDEKIYLNEDNLAANWANSKSLNGTPGSQNSVTPVNYDLAITKFESEKDYEILGNNIQFETVVKNKGVVSSKDFQLNVFLDINKDSIAEDSEILKSFQGTSLQPGDSIIYQISTNNFSLGTNPFIAKVKTSEDENLTNNSAYYNVAGININEKRNDIVINEIMYAPESPQPEWIEIYNNSNKTINLEGYQISDNSDTILAITKSTICKPGEFIVISSDSTIKNFYNISSDVISAHIPTLNNSGDKVILLDSLDRVIDSLQYFPEWGGTNGYSLERISYDNSSTDSTNWR
ncbi:MAG: lamin tail domain-containing protein, partial [Ignavibacteriaceae bacterium]